MNHPIPIDLNTDYVIEGDDSEKETDFNLNDNGSPLILGEEQIPEEGADGEEDLFAHEVDAFVVGEDSVPVVDKEHVIAPYVGMTFLSGDELLLHCHEYGKAMGFQISIRSSVRLKIDGDDDGQQPPHSDNYKRLSLVCSKAGTFQSRSKNPGKGAKTSITGYQFKVNGSISSDGVWKLTKVSLEHNHPCVPERSRFFPNYKFVSDQNRRRILENDRAGVPIAKTYSSFVVHYGGHDKVPFDERDCRNLISESRRLHLKDGDFVAMRNYFDEMSSSNSNFFYMYDMNVDGRLRNVFWADGRSRAAYTEFGDVLSFDTTYVSNRYKFPFAPFVGINHHGQSVLLGCALLCGKEIGNFVWLFRAWLKCMGGKTPQGIITDQCKSIETFKDYIDEKGKLDEGRLDSNNIQGLLSLFEASHMRTEGEHILDEAKMFCEQLLYGSIPKLEETSARRVHITLKYPHHLTIGRIFKAKDIVRMYENAQGWKKEISDLVSMEFDRSRVTYKDEFLHISKWWKELGLAKELKLARDETLKWHLWALVALPDPDLTKERIELTKLSSLVYIIDDIFDIYGNQEDLSLFTEAVNRWDLAIAEKLPDYMKKSLKAVFDITSYISHVVCVTHGRNPEHHLRKAWKDQFNAFLVESKWVASGQLPTTDEYMKIMTTATGVPLALVHLKFLLGQGFEDNENNNIDAICTNIVTSIATILRLGNDLGGAKVIYDG